MTVEELKKEKNHLSEINGDTVFVTQKRQKTTTALSKHCQSNSENTTPTKTKRFNEIRNCNTRSNHSSSKSLSTIGQRAKTIMCYDENDREIWLLKILSQILDTDSLFDVQTWLISSNQDGSFKIFT
jgi:hypothetical protein